MSMVEGIGDEVLQFFAIVTIVFLAVLAWWSTSISEAPLIRTVLILERRSRSRTTNDSSSPQPTIMNNENTIDTGQVSPTGIQELVETENVGNGNNNDDKGENESSSSILLPNSQPQPNATATGEQQQADSEIRSSNVESPELLSQSDPPGILTENIEVSSSPDSDSCVLRRRRLAFFQSRGPTLLDSSGSSDGSNDTAASTPTSDEVQEEATSEESCADQIRIRLKYLNDDQIVVEGRLQEQLGDFKRRHFRIELAAEKMVRLIFNGQVLQSDSQTLQGYGLFDNCVVHCLVHTQRNNTPRAAQTQANNSANQSTPPDWNLGVVLYTCLSIIIGFAWYCRFQYSHLFTVTTTAALLGLTGMFAVTLLGLYLPDHETIQ